MSLRCIPHNNDNETSTLLLKDYFQEVFSGDTLTILKDSINKLEYLRQNQTFINNEGISILEETTNSIWKLVMSKLYKKFSE